LRKGKKGDVKEKGRSMLKREDYPKVRYRAKKEKAKGTLEPIKNRTPKWLGYCVYDGP